jgi:hypothetical protein
MIELLLTLSGLAAVTLLFGDIDTWHGRPTAAPISSSRHDRDPEAGSIADRDAERPAAGTRP